MIDIKSLNSDFKDFMWDKHRKELPLLCLGHYEILTDELEDEYSMWLKEKYAKMSNKTKEHDSKHD